MVSLQSALNTKFTIDAHSGVLRIKAGESLDYELSKIHFVTVLAKVRTRFDRIQTSLFSGIVYEVCINRLND